MYNEIQVIKLITDKRLRILLYIDFVEEYGGWLTHIQNTGHAWGAGGEENKAKSEATKVKKHINLLKQLIMAEFAA